MLTLASQLAMSLGMLAFAVVALRVAAAIPAHARHFAYAWAFTGWAFLIEGTNGLFHDAFAILGFARGPGSSAWNEVIRWHPVLNHSRTFLLTAYCLVLTVALLRIGRHRAPPRLASALLVVLAGMGIGALVGWREAPFSAYTHFSAVALFDAMELGAIMLLLLAGLASGAMDRALWVSLAIHGLAQAYSVLLFAALAMMNVDGQWSPQPLLGQWVKAMLRATTIIVALVHLRHIRQGRPVRSLAVHASGRAGGPYLRL